MLDYALSAIDLQLKKFVSMKTASKIKFIFSAMDVKEMNESENISLKFMKLTPFPTLFACFQSIVPTKRKPIKYNKAFWIAENQ